MGLDIYLEWDGATRADREAQYRADGLEDCARVGYLRSSYNDGGFNSWARRHRIPDLYAIFGCEGEPPGPGWKIELDEDGDEVSRFYPDWQASRARVLAAVDALECIPGFALRSLSGPMTVYDRADVLPAFMKHHERWQGKHKGFEAYSNHEGVFYREEQPQVYAVMWQKGLLGGSEPVLIVQDDHTYYKQYVRMLVTWIDNAMQRPNPRMSWSG